MQDQTSDSNQTPSLAALDSNEQLSEFLVEVRRDFHRHPELSGQETRTQGRLIGIQDRLHWGHDRCDFRETEVSLTTVFRNPPAS